MCFHFPMCMVKGSQSSYEVQEGEKKFWVLKVRKLAENKTSCIPASLQRSEGLHAAGFILIITKLAWHGRVQWELPWAQIHK